MPDLVGDPKYEGVHQPATENPLHDEDPSNDHLFEAWKRNADLWREWAAKQDEAIAKLVQHGAEQGLTGDQALTKAGFVNAKEKGKHAFTMYGTGGYYSTMGAAADPGWRYDWNTGLKYNMGTADKSAHTRGVPINATEYAERAKALNYTKQGLTDYGSQANAEAFKQAVGRGHFRLDPQSGNYYSGSSPNDPANGWVDKFGRKVGGRFSNQPTGQNFQGQSTQGYQDGSYYGGNQAFGGAGGFGPGYSPGQEASSFAAADLQGAMAEGMRMDILGQQMQLQKALEGQALGGGIYDYLLNEVYGPVLGAQFQGNPQGVSQYAKSVGRGSPTTYTGLPPTPMGSQAPRHQGAYWTNPTTPGDVPRDPQGNPLPGANPGDTWGEPGPDQNPDDFIGPPGAPVRVPGTGKPKDDGTIPGPAVQSFGGITEEENAALASSLAAGSKPARRLTEADLANLTPEQRQMALANQAANDAFAASQAGIAEGRAALPPDHPDFNNQPPPPPAPNAALQVATPTAEQIQSLGPQPDLSVADIKAQQTANIKNPPLSNVASPTEAQASALVAPSQSQATTGGNVSNIQTMAPQTQVTNQGQVSGINAIGSQIAQITREQVAAAIRNGQDPWAGAPPPTDKDLSRARNVIDYKLQMGLITQQQAQSEREKLAQYAMNPSSAYQLYSANYTTTPGSEVDALGVPLPKGTYTQPGVQALDPNMNQSWARFLAPTFNKMAEATDAEQEAIRRALPRGGGQDRAISDSIRGRYGALQGAWQGLVPTALQGVSDIGKELLFQQPAANSGAMGTAAGLQAANQQHSLGLQQLKSQEKMTADTNKKGFWGSLGSSLLGAGGSILSAAISDERTKNNVSDFAEDLDDVSELEPKRFEYNGKMNSPKGQKGVSVMAQAAKKVDPKMTARMPDGAMGVKPMEILMKTVNSVKELERIVAEIQHQQSPKGRSSRRAG